MNDLLKLEIVDLTEISDLDYRKAPACGGCGGSFGDCNGGGCGGDSGKCRETQVPSVL